MKKYMKYEIKGTYKFILGILAIILIASTVIQLNIWKEFSSMSNGEIIEGFGITRFLLAISPFIIFGGFLTLFFYIIGSFRKELYEDRGYLTFTLPLSGNQILGSKLIIALLWFMLIGAGLILYNLLLATVLFRENLGYLFRELVSMINSGMISISLVGLLSSVMTLILIYFSITISKVSIKNKKIGNLWFILFLIITGLVNYFNLKLLNTIPWYINLSNLKFASLNELSMLPHVSGSIKAGILFGTNYDAYISITTLLFQLMVSVSAFLSTGYLIEKKIDL